MQNKRPDLPFRIFVLLCGAAILACGAYLAYHYGYQSARTARKSARYAALYAPSSASSSPTPAFSPAPADAPDAVSDVPLSAPGTDTIVYAFPTPPPVQESFQDLLALNPETVGYLEIGEMLSLPVVQRPNDNEYYLKHDFEGAQSLGGCLFLDGVNRLALNDQLLIIYGHNMKNGTMFGHLQNFEFPSVLAKNAIVSFDTIYENRKYVPFAAFALVADPSDPAHLDLRKFQFSKAQFDEYAAALKKRSLIDVPVDVSYGDDILLLVTCNYSVDDGRFCVALRRLRPDEREEDVRALAQQAKKR